MKKEEKEFLEEEKEEETGCELEKKQFEEKLNSCYGQNKNLTSSGEAYHRQVVNLQRFKETCLWTACSNCKCICDNC